VRASGGTITHQFHLIDAFTATVGAGELASLRANPSVAEVVPNAEITVPNPNGGSTTRTPGSPARHRRPEHPVYWKRFMPRPPEPRRPEKWQRRAQSAAYAPRGEVLKLDR
jgi:hypothetical protein